MAGKYSVLKNTQKQGASAHFMWPLEHHSACIANMNAIIKCRRSSLKQSNETPRRSNNINQPVNTLNGKNEFWTRTDLFWNDSDNDRQLVVCLVPSFGCDRMEAKNSRRREPGVVLGKPQRETCGWCWCWCVSTSSVQPAPHNTCCSERPSRSSRQQ